jgi:hypothetical protein
LLDGFCAVVWLSRQGLSPCKGIDSIAQGGHHDQHNDVVHNHEHEAQDGNPRGEAKNTVSKKESFRKDRGKDGPPLEISVEILRETPYGLKEPVDVEDRNEEETDGLARCCPGVDVLNGCPRLVQEHAQENPAVQHGNHRPIGKGHPGFRGSCPDPKIGDNEKHNGNSEADGNGTHVQTF